MKSKSNGASLAMLIGSPGKMNSEDESEDTSEDYEEKEGPSDEEVLAAEDVLMALKTKDAEELATALSDFVKACMPDKE